MSNATSLAGRPRDELRKHLEAAVAPALFDTPLEDIEVSVAMRSARCRGLVGQVTIPSDCPAGGGVTLCGPRNETGGERALIDTLAEEGWRPGTLRDLQDGGAMLSIWEA